MLRGRDGGGSFWRRSWAPEPNAAWRQRVEVVVVVAIEHPQRHLVLFIEREERSAK